MPAASDYFFRPDLARRREGDGVSIRYPRPVVAIALISLTWLSSCGPHGTPIASDENDELDDTPGNQISDVVDGTLDKSTLEALDALGYLAGYERQPDRTGTIQYDPQRAQPGYNLYISGHAPEAFLVDMDGRHLHSWKYDSRALYPIVDSKNYWRRVHLSDNGDLYALVDPHGIIKLNKDSELQWHTDGSDLLHHDLFVDAADTLYAIGRKIGPIPEIHPETSILDDTVVIFDHQGRRLDGFSIYDTFRGTEWADAIERRLREVLAFADPELRISIEAFHTNTIEVFDGSLAGVSSLLARGHAVLASPIHRNVFIINLEQRRVVWNWFGPWQGGIHQPTFLPDGHWLLFDNAANVSGQTKRSAVFEYAFPSKDKVWEYGGDSPGEEFYSRFSSLADRLPNGNTLVVVSNEGRAMEVTKEKDVVWDYYNPNSVESEMRGQKGFAARDNGQIIGTLFQLERVSSETHDRWLKRTDE